MIGEGLWKKLSGVSSPQRWLVDWAGGGKARSGVAVNETTALNYSACWCATRIIAESIACIPPITYQRVRTGGRERAQDHSLWTLLHDAPNSEMDAFTYHEMQTAFLANWGNCYAYIEKGTSRESVVALWPIHPMYVTPVRMPTREIVYEVRDDAGTVTIYPRRHILHIAGPLSENGITGKGIVRQARESIGLGLATEQFEATFFGNGAFPGGVIEHPGSPNEDATRRIKEGWKQTHGGLDNAGRTAFLREGATYKQIGWPLEDLQFLGLREFNVTEIARWYRIPPHMLADLTRATFSNIEEQGLEFLTYTVMPWVRRIEQAYNTQLLDPANPYYIEFLMDALERAKTQERAESLKTQFMHGALTLDQWCELENRNPVGGEIGSVHWVPVNLAPAESILKQAEEPTEQPQPRKQGESQREPMASQDAIDACYLALMATIDRMQVKESMTVCRAAKHRESFLSAVEAFYQKHRATFLEAIGPSLDAYNAVSGECLDAETIYSRHMEAALASLAEAADAPQEFLGDTVAVTCGNWHPAQFMEHETCPS